MSIETSRDIGEITRRYDPFATETAACKWAVLEHAREHCPILPVHPGPDPNTAYSMITRYRDARYVLEHPEIFSGCPRWTPTHPNNRSCARSSTR
jgi:hypothetical protein